VVKIRVRLKSDTSNKTLSGDISTFMIIRTLFTDLPMVDMLATITNMTTYFLLTMIISFAKFTKF